MDLEKSAGQSNGEKEKSPSTTTKSGSVFSLYAQLGDMLHALRRGEIDCKTVNAACNLVGKQVDIVRLVFEHANLVDRGVIKESLPMMEGEPVQLVENNECDALPAEPTPQPKTFGAKDWKPTPKAMEILR
jgi:hypothetical protein